LLSSAHAPPSTDNGDADTDDLSGLSFRANTSRSMPCPLFDSLEERLCGKFARDLVEPLGVLDGDVC
jgi:hypothetical protein